MLLDEARLLRLCRLTVDLNPIRAAIAETTRDQRVTRAKDPNAIDLGEREDSTQAQHGTLEEAESPSAQRDGGMSPIEIDEQATDGGRPLF